MLSKQPLPNSNSNLKILPDQLVLARPLQQNEFLQRNAEKLGSIELFAELSVGFTIAFMEVNTDQDRQIVIEYLHNSDRFPHVQWVPIALADESLQYFGLEVREKLQTIALNPDRQPVLLISGLERSIGAFGEYPAVLSNLNMERDSYPRILPYPIVLLLPGYAITRCARYAPDFWSWKSIDVQLQSETPAPEISPPIKPLATDLTTVKPVSQSRFDLLTQLLAENPEPTVDRARLLNQLGDAYRSIYENEQAESSYRSALAIYDNLPASLDRAKTMDGLARLYNFLGKYSAALQLWPQALTIQQEIGDRQGEAASLHQMSMVYQTLGDLPQALALSQQSIEIQREMGDQLGEAGSLHQMSIIYQTLGDLPQALALCEQSIKIKREIGDRQGEAASLAQMAAIAYQQDNTVLEQKLYLQSAVLLGTIGNYSGLIITLRNLGTNNEPDALGYLAQSLWLTLKLPTNLENTITLIESIYHKIPTGDPLESLLGATAIHLCHHYKHPELDQLSVGIINHAAEQQSVTTPADFDNWFTQNRLNDPEYFLPLLMNKLESIVGDSWLFDKDVFLKGNRSA
jgi:tetratricopeptide (TPR) repeat protein